MDIVTLAYTLYKIDWLRHISHDRIADLVKNYYDAVAEAYPNSKERPDPEYGLSDYFEDYGFDGETYDSYTVFVYGKFLDKDYMKTLLNEKQYCEYLKYYEFYANSIPETIDNNKGEV